MRRRKWDRSQGRTWSTQCNIVEIEMEESAFAVGNQFCQKKWNLGPQYSIIYTGYFPNVEFFNVESPQHNIEEIGFEESAFAKGTKTRSTFLNQCRKERLGRIKQVRFPTILATVLTGCHRWPGGRPENT